MQKGITLIELVISIALISIVVTFVSWGLVTGLRAWNSGKDRAEVRQETALAIEIMVRDISQADTITKALASDIIIVGDIDNDSVNETVEYDVSAPNIIRTLDGTETILLRDVQTFTLSYRDLNNNVMTPPGGTSNQAKRDNIRVVGITLTINKNNEQFTSSSSVFCRNQ